MKRRGFMALAAATPLLLSGCITSNLIDEVNSSEEREYKETISSVLVSADGGKLVFIGADYHYIFDAPEHFAATLQSSLHQRIEAEVGRFNVASDQHISGVISLKVSVPVELTPEEKRQLMDFGFDENIWSRSISLSGMRYSAKHFDRSKVSPTLLNRSYEVTVEEQVHSKAKELLLLMTPVTVALDGVLCILAVPLIPVGLFFVSRLQFTFP